MSGPSVRMGMPNIKLSPLDNVQPGLPTLGDLRGGSNMAPFSFNGLFAPPNLQLGSAPGAQRTSPQLFGGAPPVPPPSVAAPFSRVAPNLQGLPPKPPGVGTPGTPGGKAIQQMGGIPGSKGAGGSPLTPITGPTSLPGQQASVQPGGMGGNVATSLPLVSQMFQGRMGALR